MDPRNAGYILIILIIVAGGYYAYTQVFGSTMGTTSDTALDDGLVGHWTFDGPDMINNVADVSGNGNDGNLTHGGSGTTTVPGQLGQALEFDGSDDYVEVAHSSELDVGGSDNASWAFWVNIADEKANIVSKGNDENDSLRYKIAYESSGGDNDIEFATHDKGGWHSVASNGNITAGAWQHVVVTWDGSNINFYFNGSLDSSKSFNTGDFPSTSEVLEIGQTTGDGFYANGTIDDVRIYDRALSATEVKQLYNTGKVEHAKTPDGNTTGLVGHWTMDGPDTLTNIADVSGSGNDGNLIHGGSGTTTKIGRVGQALEFDGSDDYVEKSGPIPPDGASAVTVSVWVKSDTTGVDAAILGTYKNTGNDDGVGMRYDASGFSGGGSSVIKFAVENESGTSVNGETESNLQTTKWQHLVLRWSSGNAPELFANGGEVSYTSAPSSLSGTVEIPDFHIGRGLKDADGFWNGLIDEVRIYNRKLSNDEIKQLYNTGKTEHTKTPDGNTTGLVGHWTMDGPDTLTNITDTSGNGNDGNLVHGGSGTSTIPGQLGQALEFDGSDDYVDIDVNLTIDAPSAGTVCAWAKNGNAYNSGVKDWIINESTDASNEFQMGHYSNNNLYFGFVSGGRVSFSANASNWPQGIWTHYCTTYGGSSIVAYINGASAGSSSFSSVPSGAVLRIGAQNTSNFFKGAIDDVRIYNRALSAEEVKQLYNMGR